MVRLNLGEMGAEMSREKGIGGGAGGRLRRRRRRDGSKGAGRVGEAEGAGGA